MTLLRKNRKVPVKAPPESLCCPPPPPEEIDGFFAQGTYIYKLLSWSQSGTLVNRDVAGAVGDFRFQSPTL